MMLLFGGCLFMLPCILQAQTVQWPWSFKGGNFNLNNTLNDNSSPAVAASDESTGIFLVVWTQKGTTTGFDIYGARINTNGYNLDGIVNLPICTALNDQVFPSVSWNGETFLVVWQDGRNGGRSDIYGARVTPQGIVLDPDGFPIHIGTSLYNQVLPVVSFDGTNHLVVWEGQGKKNIHNIYCTRVSPEGEVLDQQPIPLAPSAQDQTYPAVDFDGNNYLVVWSQKESSSQWDVMGARVTPLGEVIDTEPVKINSSPSGTSRKPVLSWNGESYLVVWVLSTKTGQWSLYGKRVGPDMEILDSTDVDIESDGTEKLYLYPAVFWDGSNYLLVWEEEDSGNSFSISGATVTTGGPSISVSSPVVISFAGLTANSSFPALATLGDTALVVWDGNALPNEYLQVFGQTLSETN